jgi:hypothetical protein
LIDDLCKDSVLNIDISNGLQLFHVKVIVQVAILGATSSAFVVLIDIGGLKGTCAVLADQEELSTVNITEDSLCVSAIIGMPGAFADSLNLTAIRNSAQNLTTD